MGSLPVVPEEKRYGFYVGNPSWNSDMKYIELQASFMNPDLVGKYTPSNYFKRFLFNNVPKIDAMEGRWDKVSPIFQKYGLKSDSGGWEPLHITIPADSREDALSRLEQMGKEVEKVCGESFPVKFEMGDICFSFRRLNA